MIKKFNYCLIGFFMALTCTVHYGAIFLLPIYIYYISKTLKNIIYFGVSGLLSIGIFNMDKILFFCLIIASAIFLSISCSLLKNKLSTLCSYVIISLLIVVFNLFIFFLLYKDIEVIHKILLSLISGMFFVLLSLDDLSIFKGVVPISFTYVIKTASLIALLGSSDLTVYSIPFILILSVYFVMYFSRTTQGFIALLYDLIVFFYLHFIIKNELSYVVLVIGLFYYYKSIFMFIFSNVFLLSLLIYNSFESATIILIISLETIIFEIISILLIDKTLFKKHSKKEINYILEDISRKDLNTFSNFLEFFSFSFKDGDNYTESVGKAIKAIKEKHCDTCKLRQECFVENKYKLHNYFKKILEKEPLDINFKRYCTSINSISQTAANMYVTMKNIQTESQSIMLGIITSMSRIISIYNNEQASKKTINANKIHDFEEGILSLNETIEKINYIRLYEDDFYIEVHIQKSIFIDTNIVKRITDHAFNIPCQVKLESNKTDTFLKIIPFTKLTIEFGYGNLASKKNDMCGDNYLIKTYDNGHFAAVISDGMGKGYVAYNDSKRAIETIDAISGCSLNPQVNLEIINTLYMLQGYTERYSTIDYLDINRINSVATFYKLGATTSYIFRQLSNVIKIENKSLPLGVEEDITFEQYILQSGDLIIMSSDGIIENVLNEQALMSLINEIKHENPQKIVYELLEYVLHTAVKTRDDMSVIVLKVK